MTSILDKVEFHLNKLDQFGNTHLIISELEKEGIIDHEAWIEICHELEKRELPYEALEALNVSERYFEDNINDFNETDKEFFYESKAENIYDIALNNEFDDFIFESALNSFLKVTKVIPNYDNSKIWGYIAEIQNALSYEDEVIYKSLLASCDDQGNLNIHNGINLGNIIKDWSGEKSVTGIARLFVYNKQIVKALELYLFGFKQRSHENEKELLSSMVYNLFLYGKNEI